MPSDIDISSYVEKFESFYSDALREKINQLLTEYPVQKSLVVDYEDLEKYDRELADLLVKQPDTLINAAELALVQSQEVAFKTSHQDAAFEPHVRFFNLPDAGLLIQDIGSRNIRELISVKGVVTKRGPILHKVKVAVYKCQMCDATTKVPTTKHSVVPQVCSECKRRALKLEEEDSYFVDVQKAEAQELLERLTGGSPAATITLWMEDDLVNRVTPGDTIEITGVMRLIPPSKPRSGAGEGTQIYTRYIDVVYAKKTQKDFEEIETTKEDEERIRELATDPKIYDKMYASVAQGIYGHNEVKEALTLQLFGGTKDKFIPGGAPIRNDIHILLIGDPGTAKTRFLQYVKDLAPKGIFVSGKSVTGVGLTASAEKDDLGDGGWTLKAGALVIASGGIASVDEFDKIDEGERAAMHEVMESQSYHPSTKLMLADGREVMMGGFVEGLLSQNRSRVKIGKDCLVLDSGLEGINVLTSDFERIYPINISQVSKHKAPGHFIKVTLQNGRTLIVTPEHPFWALDGSDISTKPASELKCRDFTTIPSRLPICPPANTSADLHLFKFLGYHISDGGYELNRGKKNGINFWNKDEDIIEDYLGAAEPIFHSHFSLSTDSRTGVGAARLTSMDAVETVMGIGPLLMEKGSKKALPEHLMAANDECAREFLSAIFEGDGSISNNGTLSLACGNLRLAEQVQTLLLRFGVEAHIIRDSNVFRLYSTGEGNLLRFSSKVGFVSKRKQKKLEGCIRAKAKGKASRRFSYSESVPVQGKTLLSFAAKLKLAGTRVFGCVVSPSQPAFSRPMFTKALAAMRQRLENIKDFHLQISHLSIRKLAANRKKLGISQADIGGAMQRSLVGYWERHAVMEGRYKEKLGKCCSRILACEPELERLEKLLNSEIRFCRIKSVETVKNDGVEWVYDVGAGPTKAFISECALLHNTVSVAKAGIVAQFRAKTSILAAANPKFGRFDPNQLPGKQFDIPPTILSRFDLIFPVIDVMDEVKDAALADFMLKTHAAGSEAADKAEVDPNVLPKAFMRKYISYARQHFRPRLTDTAMKKIKDYYVELRKKGKADGAVPITPRQIEGLVRLSEASAKLRLSDTVDDSDAERAIRLTEYVLEKVSRDRETGKLDIDIIATGRPKSQVDKITAIMAIAARIQAQLGAIEVARLVAQATDEGITDEMTIRRMIDDLIYKGELYKIKPGFVKIVNQVG